ncbi:MAG: ribosome hibernation-promoting factor, HPF/YfiA family [Cellvibrio sp.]
MQVTITGHNLEVTEALHNYAATKIEKLNNHHDRITSVQVRLTIDKMEQVADGTLHVSGKDLHAEARHEDLYAAIDLMVDKLDRQLLKHKEILRAHR